MSKPVITFVFKVLRNGLLLELPLEFSRVVTAQNGQTIKAGTQILDKNWGHMKSFIPNSITTKDATCGLLNGDI